MPRADSDAETTFETVCKCAWPASQGHASGARSHGRAEKTGVLAPRDRQLRLPTTPRRVDVLADCGKIILYGRDRLKLTTQEVDYLFKKLRKTFELRDPLTRDWLATDSQARVHFLFNEVLRPAMSEIKLRRWIEQLRAQVGDGEMADDEVPGEPEPSRRRLLPP